MRQHPPEIEGEEIGTEREDLEQYTSYEDAADHVICDKQNPAAWLRSDVTVDVSL